MTGALALTAVTLPSSRSPRGEFLAPFTLFQTPPPMAPMAKAPPMSSKMRCGQGSRSCTDIRGSPCVCTFRRPAGLSRRWYLGEYIQAAATAQCITPGPVASTWDNVWRKLVVMKVQTLHDRL
jgi:hypothetical protein